MSSKTYNVLTGVEELRGAGGTHTFQRNSRKIISPPLLFNKAVSKMLFLSCCPFTYHKVPLPPVDTKRVEIG